MGIKYTSTPYSKANFTAILAIPRSELPDPASGLYPLLTAIDTGNVYKFDPDSTTVGTLPTGASGAGRWIAISSKNQSLAVSMSQGSVQTINTSEVLRVYQKDPSGGTSLIPTMTSNTLPSPFIASTNGSANGLPYMLFDNVLTDRGWLASSQTGCYVQIDLGSAMIADSSSFLVTSTSISAIEYAKKLTLFASNDGINFGSALLSIINWTPLANSFLKYSFTPTTARYWRLFLEDATGGYPAVNEWKLLLSSNINSYTDTTSNFSIQKQVQAGQPDIATITKNSVGTQDILISYL